MEKHFKNIQKLYNHANVRIPNNVFIDLSSIIKSKNNKTNIQQVAFAYVYLITIGFLYKYAHYVDLDNGSYIQNSDIKLLLGYSKSTKSIDRIIKREGVLDSMGLTVTNKDYPVQFYMNHREEIDGIKIREFITFQKLSKNHILYPEYKSIVKNKNYEIKEPLFLTSEYGDNEQGTLYCIEKTHQISIEEFLLLVFDAEIDNIDILMYFYFKSKCKGFKKNTRQISLLRIVGEIGMDGNTFYNHLNTLKEKKYIDVSHKGWKHNTEEIEINEYTWLGTQ